MPLVTIKLIEGIFTDQQKQAIGEIRSLKEEMETLRERLEREQDLEKAAEIRYGRIPELERKLHRAPTDEEISEKIGISVDELEESLLLLDLLPASDVDFLA